MSMLTQSVAFNLMALSCLLTLFIVVRLMVRVKRLEKKNEGSEGPV